MRITLRYDAKLQIFRAQNRKSFDLLAKIKDGMACQVEWYLSRNGKHHSLAWIFVGLVADAMNDGPSALFDAWDDERVMEHVKLAVGVSDIYKLPPKLAKKAGCPVAIKSGSISFAKMDQARFAEFFEAMLLYVQTELSPHIEQSPQWPQIDKIIRRVRDPMGHNGGPALNEKDAA